MRRSARQVQHFVRAPLCALGLAAESLLSARALAVDDRCPDAVAIKARGAPPDASCIGPARAAGGGPGARRSFLRTPKGP